MFFSFFLILFHLKQNGRDSAPKKNAINIDSILNEMITITEITPLTEIAATPRNKEMGGKIDFSTPNLHKVLICLRT